MSVKPFYSAERHFSDLVQGHDFDVLVQEPVEDPTSPEGVASKKISMIREENSKISDRLAKLSSIAPSGQITEKKSIKVMIDVSRVRAKTFLVILDADRALENFKRKQQGLLGILKSFSDFEYTSLKKSGKEELKRFEGAAISKLLKVPKEETQSTTKKRSSKHQTGSKKKSKPTKRRQRAKVNTAASSSSNTTTPANCPSLASSNSPASVISPANCPSLASSNSPVGSMSTPIPIEFDIDFSSLDTPVSEIPVSKYCFASLS